MILLPQVQLQLNASDFQPLIDREDLEGGGDELHRLLLINPIIINGVHHHLEAVQVREGDGQKGEMDVVQADGNDSALGAYWDLNGDNPRTIEIEGLPGRRYFLMLYPHAT